MNFNQAAIEPAKENLLLEGLKELIRSAIREELGNVQPPEPEKLLLNVTEAAKIMNVPKTWLASMAREGKIKSVKLGHYVRFARTDLEAFILQMKNNSD